MNDFSDQQFNITHVLPEGHRFAQATQEMAETLLYGLEDLGCPTSFGVNQIIPEARNVFVGAHLVEQSELGLVPENSIIFNTEQLYDGSKFLTPTYLHLLKNFEVWDYSAKNVAYINDKLSPRIKARQVPLGYSAKLTRIAKSGQRDIDVLFYGSLNERRKACLEDMAARGIRVKHLYGVYGKQRDAYIARSKIVLNLHFFEAQVFEAARVSYLLANKTAVVSEQADEHADLDQYHDCIRFAPYDQLTEACLALLGDDVARETLERESFANFSARKARDYIAAALGGAGPRLADSAPSTKRSQLPTRINFGSGRDFRDDFLNIDINDKWLPDICIDLSQDGVIGQRFETQRFGVVELSENSIDEIYCLDVLEHVPNLIGLMTNFLTILAVGGRLKVMVPYDLSLGAWQDPTHVRAFNENSWKYYTEWYWYLDWDVYRFEAVEMKFHPSKYGHELLAKGVGVQELARSPRAVDSIYVELRKVALTPQEVVVARQEHATTRRTSRDAHFN